MFGDWQATVLRKVFDFSGRKWRLNNTSIKFDISVLHTSVQNRSCFISYQKHGNIEKLLNFEVRSHKKVNEKHYLPLE